MSWGEAHAVALALDWLIVRWITPPPPPPRFLPPPSLTLTPDALAPAFDRLIDAELDALRRHYGGEDGCDLRQLGLDPMQTQALLVLALSNPRVVNITLTRAADAEAVRETLHRLRDA